MSNYESLFRLTADAMCELDTHGKILNSNPACEQMLGPAMPAVGGSLFELFDEAGQHALTNVLRELHADITKGAVNGRIPDTATWINWHLTRIDDGHIIAVGRDVSKHHHTADALASKSSFLHSIIEAEPECVKLVSPAGELLDMNQAGLTMIAAPSRDEAIGLNTYDLIAPEDRNRFIKFNERVCCGESGELSFDIIAMDGTRRSMETTAVPLENNPNGETVQLAITRDVSERLVLEDQLQHARKMDAIGQMAGGIAHDFNNLLTAIVGPAELALLKVDEHSEVANDLRQIQSTGKRAARLTRKLLAFARREEAQLTAIAVPELIQNMQELLEHLLGGACFLDLDIDSGVPAARADRVQLEQLLLNLTLNARDAIDRSGHIRVSVTAADVPPDRAKRIGCKAGPHIILKVSDNGRGIDPSHIARIFDPFFTTKQPGAGTGLGLSTCYGIVVQLGGAIEVESTVGNGTTFTVTLPADDHKNLELLQRQRPQAGGQTILVVDDEPNVRQAVCRMLESAGFQVHSCDGAKDALKLATRITKLDLLVTDMAMPGMSGRDLVTMLRKTRPTLPVLFTTGYLPSLSQDTHDSFPPESNVLLKPFTSQILSSAVLRAIQGEIGSTDPVPTQEPAYRTR